MEKKKRRVSLGIAASGGDDANDTRYPYDHVSIVREFVEQTDGRTYDVEMSSLSPFATTEAGSRFTRPKRVPTAWNKNGISAGEVTPVTPHRNAWRLL